MLARSVPETQFRDCSRVLAKKRTRWVVSCLDFSTGRVSQEKKKKRRRTRQAREALALNQFFFQRGPLLTTKTRRAYPTFATLVC